MVSYPKRMVILVVIFFFLAGCTMPPPQQVQSEPASQPAAITPPAQEEATAPILLKVAVAPFLSYAPFYIAEAEGYFDEQGLDVEIVRVTRSSDAIASLVQGQLDVAGFPVSSALINAIVRDSSIKIVASKERLVEQTCVYSGIIARSGSGISDASEINPEILRTLKFDITPTGVSGFVLDTLLQRYGLSLDEITLADTPNAAATLDGMLQGTVDVAAMTEPWITRARSTGAGDVWLARGEVAPDNQLAIVAFGPTLLKDNPQAGERFMVAYLQAVRRFSEGMTESTLALLEKELELDPSLLSIMCPPYIPLDGAINAQSIIDFATWALARDLIDAPITVEQFWEPRFVEYARQALEGSR